MGEKLSPKQLELSQGMDEILWKDWGPIGVSEILSARDEYFSYFPIVFNMTTEGVAPLKLAQYLHNVTQENMGLSSSNIDLPMTVAEKIIQLKKQMGR